MIIFRRFLVVLLAVEVMVFCAPFVLPGALYYQYYVGDKSLATQQEFYTGVLPSIPHPQAGWSNSPNFSKGLWHIDQWGARTHEPVALERTTGASRVLFLGNSLMNGSNTLPVEDSISYYFDQISEQQGHSVETMNFATMAYNAGQSYLQLKHQLLQFKPDHVVLGLEQTAYAGLDNLYLPFYLVDERNMPYVKPGFFDQEGELEVMPPPHDLAKTDKQAFVDHLEQHDSYFDNFKRYQHFCLSPVLWSVNYVVQKAQNMMGYFDFDPQEFNVLHLVLAEIEKLGQQEGFTVSYVYFPTSRAFGQSLLWRHMPDFYQERYELLANPNDIHSEGLQVLNARSLLKASQKPLADLYQGDFYHFAGPGNQIIAQGIYDQVSSSLYKEP